METKNDALALAIRTADKNHQSYGKFQWPKEIGSIIECNDWDENEECGNGIHALLDGWGDWSLLSNDVDAIWQIVEVDRTKCVDLRGKVKFRQCRLVYSGLFAGAMKIISEWQINILTNSTQNNDNFTETNSEEGKKLIGSSGDYSKIGSSGDCAQICSSGDRARIGSSGYYAQIGSSGDSSQIGSSGDYARICSSGYCARIGSSGDRAKIGSSGYSARIEATGDCVVLASAGLDTKFSIGKNGCAAIPYFDGARTRFAIAYEGENVVSGVFYSVDKKGNFHESGSSIGD